MHFFNKKFRATVVCTSIACLIFKVVIFSWESVLLRYSYILTISYIVGHYFSKKTFEKNSQISNYRFHNKHHLFRDHIIIQLNYEKLENNELWFVIWFFDYICIYIIFWKSSRMWGKFVLEILLDLSFGNFWLGI